MHLLNLFLIYVLVGTLVGVCNYVVAWREFRRAGRSGELPGNLLEQSVCYHAFAWPETAFWCVLCLLSMIFFVRRQK